MGRTLVVMRHGQTAHNAGNIWQGHLDTELSAVGRAQAAAAASVVAGFGPAAIWSSDLSRAMETAAAVASVAGLSVTYDARLREVDVGRWQGMTAGDVAEQYPDEHAALSAGEDVRRGVEGETVAEVTVRVRAAADDLLATLGPDACGVVVSHGVAGRALAASLAGLEPGLAWLALGGLGNCHWARLAESRAGTGWRITHWNEGVRP